MLESILDQEKMAQQYDVSPEFRKLFERKQQQRAEFRAQFMKQWLNPYRIAAQEGHHIFDPAIHRFHAMHTYADEFLRPNKRNFKYLWWGTLFPIIVLAQGLKYYYGTYEAKIVKGEIAYADRRQKTLL